MTDHDALLRAICDHPDEDTPRLVFADFLEEQNQPDRAAFIRAQVELARTPEWEPFAAFCRHRRPEWDKGGPYRHTLPPVDGSNLEWSPEPFRRGFGRWLVVRSLGAWEVEAARLFESAPVSSLTLHTATLDDWRGFVAGPFFPRLRRLTFTTSPVEPVRALCELKAPAGVTHLTFKRSSGASMPEIVEELLQTPFGTTLRGVHFHLGLGPPTLLMEALAAPDAARLERLAFTTLNMTGEHVGILCRGPAAANLTELRLRNQPLGEGVRVLAAELRSPTLRRLDLVDVAVEPGGLEALGAADAFAGLRLLDLSRNVLRPKATKVLASAPSQAGLRAVRLKRCAIGDKGVRHLAAARFWPNLVELDLRENPISSAGARHLLNAPVPPDLTALLLDAGGLNADVRAKLRERYGESLILTPA
jgi:uncharacterized protein (TIGR02996 family)